MTALARIGTALLTIYALGWAGLAAWVAVAASGLGAALLLVIAAVCAGLAFLGPPHPVVVGALLLVPGTFPLGLGSAALSDASGWTAVSALLWFAVLPFVIGVLFLVDALVRARRRRRERIAEIESRPPLPSAGGTG